MSGHGKPLAERRFKIFPDAGRARIVDAQGNDIMALAGGPERVEACLRAFNDIWFPEAHLAALTDHADRLEGLRSAAWAEKERLEVASAEFREKQVRQMPSVIADLRAAQAAAQERLRQE